MKKQYLLLAILLMGWSIVNKSNAQCPVINCPGDTILYLGSDACQVLLEYENPEVTDFCFNSTTFDYTGSEEFWVVPEGVHEVLVDAYGAQGGHGSGTEFELNTGGKGSYIQALLDVIPGDTLFIRVGGKGQDAQVAAIALGGWNGGGDGGLDVENANNGGAGGGGATDVRIGSSDILQRVLVAAGGGGAAKDAPGGGGGAPDGINGAAFGAGESGIGATLEMGGWAATTDRGATNGYLGLGGHGSTNHPSFGGGGGGAGLYGGSGGTSVFDYTLSEAGGGGGGSSFYAGPHETIMLANEKSGNGMLTISYSDPNGMFAEKLSGPESGTMLSPGEYELVFAAFTESSTVLCPVSVSVLDTVAPQAFAKDITVFLDENNTAIVSPDQVDNGSYDNCELASKSLSQHIFTNINLGINPVELTVVDASGNTAVANAMIRVRTQAAVELTDRTTNDNNNGMDQSLPTLKSMNTQGELLESAQLKINPNPAKDQVQLNIQLPDYAEDVWLTATSLVGQRKMQVNIPYLNNEDSYKFSVEGWIPGIYIVQISTRSESLTQRLVVR